MSCDHIPRRVVSLQPSATVILSVIGKLHHLVACTKYCADVCPETGGHRVSIISDSWTANAHQIADAKPDLIVSSLAELAEAAVAK